MNCVIPVFSEKQTEKNFFEKCLTCKKVLVLVVVDISLPESATEIFSHKKTGEKIVAELKKIGVPAFLEIEWGETLKVLIKTAKKFNAKKIFVPKNFFSKKELKELKEEKDFELVLL